MVVLCRRYEAERREWYAIIDGFLLVGFGGSGEMKITVASHRKIAQ
jgi:hypothetical protein